MRIFLDANVIFSASLPGSRMGEFLDVLAKKAELLTSEAAIDEATRNLERKSARELPKLRRLVKRLVTTAAIAELPGIQLVEKDHHILGAAIASQCTHLLTGDERHFMHLFGKTVGRVKIVHARLLAEEIGLRRSD